MRVKYIGEKETLTFERNKTYEVLAVEKGWLRVMTDLEEDYLFPPEVFDIADQGICVNVDGIMEDN